MSNMPNIPGLENAPIQHLTTEQFTYDEIPVLRDLLPMFRGIPGYYYLQASVANQKRAEGEGWVEVANSVTYTIRGPKGSIDVRLYCYGRRIPSIDHKSSKRECFIDRDILEATGLSNASAVELATAPLTQPEPRAPMAPLPAPEPVVLEKNEDGVELMTALCGKEGLKGIMGKAAHERRCGACAQERERRGE